MLSFLCYNAFNIGSAIFVDVPEISLPADWWHPPQLTLLIHALDAREKILELFRYVAGGLLALVGIYIVLLNYIRQISNFRNRHKTDARHSSPAPFVGPLFIIVGYFLAPVSFSKWIFLVFMFDPDTLLVVFTLPFLIKGMRG